MINEIQEGKHYAFALSKGEQISVTVERKETNYIVACPIVGPEAKVILGINKWNWVQELTQDDLDNAKKDYEFHQEMKEEMKKQNRENFEMVKKQNEEKKDK